MRDTGTSRTALLVILGCSIAVVVAGGIWLVQSPGSGDPDVAGVDDAYEDGDEPREIPTGSGRSQRGSTRTPRSDGSVDPEDADPDFEEFQPLPGGPGGREPDGPDIVVDENTLRQALKDNDWEKFRGEIDVFGQTGRVVPEDVIRALVELLKTDERRLDAMLALGQVKDAFTGRMLAGFAADPSMPEDARVKALMALAKSGQSAGLGEVRDLVEGATADTPVVRAALFALAGMGGPEGAAPLLAALAAHPDDGLTDAVTTAISKLKGADAALSQVLRDARRSGDVAQVEAMLKVGQRMGAAAGAEIQAEVRALIESAAGLSAFEKDPDAAKRLRFNAMYVAGSMGGAALDAVIQLARSETGDLRTVAFTALRNARGDEAAKKIAGLMSAELDVPGRYGVVAALGATGSRVATPTVHAALDDPDGSVREIASSVLADLRDPASVPLILSKIDAANGNRLIATSYVKALGQIGVNDALPKLEALAASKDEFWKGIQPWIKKAISDIKRENRDTSARDTLLDAVDAQAAQRKPGTQRK